MDSGPSVVHVALRLWLPVADKPPVVEQVGEPWPEGVLKALLLPRCEWSSTT